jgi:starch synthase (maltosyl-transferring)
LRDVVLFWVAQGVRIFRVDNPHTKAFPFWEWLIREVQTVDPDVTFLSEAFTRPKVMKALAKLGFSHPTPTSLGARASRNCRPT